MFAGLVVVCAVFLRHGRLLAFSCATCDGFFVDRVSPLTAPPSVKKIAPMRLSGPDFKDQPTWRNGSHLVTDFRGGEGRTRYYVVASNPTLDEEVYQEVLASMYILP